MLVIYQVLTTVREVPAERNDCHQQLSFLVFYLSRTDHFPVLYCIVLYCTVLYCNCTGEPQPAAALQDVRHTDSQGRAHEGRLQRGLGYIFIITVLNIGCNKYFPYFQAVL